ncbi:hypothetical protein TL16_g02130 [Triparma laevis f. inornata]|uniref:Uncharacterized protein n=1 Tax=Triparma laevis f. inornata TaxID=1714386 RepID=A0A9W6ZQA1_9STRA|nr:hypothetical protein TL16_g02130 [Triparma laevis f. inornata]
MTILDSLQTLGRSVFIGCFGLVAARIAVYEEEDDEDDEDDEDFDVTTEAQVVAYLNDQQRIAAELASRQSAERDKITANHDEIVAKRDEEVAALKEMVAALSLENAELKMKIASTTPCGLQNIEGEA